MTSKYVVLIIEDEKNISNWINKCLTEQGYKVLTAFTGKEGLSLLNSQCPDVTLLDLGLPDMDGITIIPEFRKWSENPIIVVSARTSETEKVKALELGADDYITKPFGTNELMARIKTALRHISKPDCSYKCKDLTVDFTKRVVSLNGIYVHLTPVEYKIVSYLAQNAGKVITHSALMTYVWGPFIDSDNKILRVNMANIRRKLENNPVEPKYIYTEVGVGYRMSEDENTSYSN